MSPTPAQGIEALPEPLRTAVMIALAIALLFAAAGITALMRGVAPEQHKRDSDRRLLAFQRRLFRGHYPLGKYRTPFHSRMNRIAIWFTWINTSIIVVAILYFTIQSHCAS